MQIIPNNTIIKATVIEIIDNAQFLKLVILEIPNDKLLTPFLHIGKIITVKNLFTDRDLLLSIEDIISSEIEVLGGPFKQVYLLHHISKPTNS